MESQASAAVSPAFAAQAAAARGTAPLVPALARALTLLERVAQQPGPMSLARLAAELALPKSSVHGLCGTLLSFGYLRRQGEGGFMIGPRVMHLAAAFVSSTSAAQEFNALWADAPALPEETLILSVLDGAEVVYVAARHGTRPLGLAFNVGMRLPAHLAATGKAMLAFHEPAELRRRFPASPLPRPVGRGAASLDELKRELALTRQRGYSVDEESLREGVHSIAAPVFDASGTAVAAVGVCIPQAMLGSDKGRRYREMVIGVAGSLSRRLGGEVPAPAARKTARRAGRPW
jgi:DNA-binding IclR family transcriptional regulator